MAETIHIFDEFPWDIYEITDEQRALKRHRLEPHVFSILRKKYGATLEESYRSKSPPRESTKCILIVERRVHENLEFLLHNCAYFGPDWSIAFVCSDINADYCREIAGPHRQNLYFLEEFSGSPGRDAARTDYNQLLKSAEFWRKLPWDLVAVVQTDSYFLRKIPDCVLEYDFIACTASSDPSQMVGGMSFRRPQKMVAICERFLEPIDAEDVYFSKGANALQLKMPGIPDRFFYCAESCFWETAIGTHQWWTYFFPQATRAELIFHTFLTLIL